MARASKAHAGDHEALPEALPSGVRFEKVFGFVDEYGDRWHWEAGQVVHNPAVISMLLNRQAPVVVIGGSLA
jgi:hypothetical protein